MPQLRHRYAIYQNSERCIAELRVLVDMQYNRTQLKSAEEFIQVESLGVQNNVSVACEQYQNRPAESSINSVMLLN